MRRSATILVPGAVVAVALGAVLLLGVRLGLADTQWWPRYLPLVLFTGALLVGARMNQSRLSFLALGGFFGFLTLAGGSFVVEEHRVLALVVGGGTALLTGFIFSWEERGVFTHFGILRGLMIAGPCGVVWGLATFHPEALAVLVPRALLAGAGGRVLPLPWPAALLTAAAVGLLVAKGGDDQDQPIYISFLLAVAIGLALGAPEAFCWNASAELTERMAAGRVAQALFCGAGAAILLLAVLEHSYGSAYLDPLTGLPGRRALDHRFSSLGATFVIAMVDIDRFKLVNDRYGHDVGDQGLRFLARCLNEVEGGTAYRFGGEEFCIVFPRRSGIYAREVLEMLRKTVEFTPFYLRSDNRPEAWPEGAERPAGEVSEACRIPLTISIGYAAVRAGEMAPAETLLAADRALYRAKEGGRNRVAGEASRGEAEDGA